MSRGSAPARRISVLDVEGDALLARRARNHRRRSPLRSRNRARKCGRDRLPAPRPGDEAAAEQPPVDLGRIGAAAPLARDEVAHQRDRLGVDARGAVAVRRRARRESRGCPARRAAGAECRASPASPPDPPSGPTRGSARKTPSIARRRDASAAVRRPCGACPTSRRRNQAPRGAGIRLEVRRLVGEQHADELHLPRQRRQRRRAKFRATARPRRASACRPRRPRRRARERARLSAS